MSRRSACAGATIAAGVLLAGAVTASPAYAVTPVTCSTADLISKITASNAGVGDTLSLTSYCVYTLTDADGQLPQITKPLVIQGNNATIRRDPAATTNFRIFDVSGAALTMDTLTIMNGAAFNDLGGGVHLSPTEGTSLSATDVNFRGNMADEGGAIYAESRSSLSLTGGTLTDNRATSFGGALGAEGLTPVTLDSVTVSHNHSLFNAGGISLSNNRPMTITNSIISNNTAVTSAGGLQCGCAAPLTITGTTIADNRVTASLRGSGGLQIDAGSGGSATITDSTISGNVVTGFPGQDQFTGRGGGIQLLQGPLTLDHTVVSGNQLIGTGSFNGSGFNGGGLGAGIAVNASNPGSASLTLQNGTTVTGNLASGRNSHGGGLYAQNANGTVSVTVTDSHIDGNKVTGTGSSAGGVYNVDASFSFTNSSVNNNTAPAAPAPGAVSTGVAITSVDGATTFTGNTPTNCLLSPAAVTNCLN